MKEYRVTVDGVSYEKDKLYSIRLTRPLFDKFSVGNACSAKLELTYYPDSTPGVAAEVKVYQRNQGETNWKPLGVFYIDERTRPYYGRVSLVCYDAIMGIDHPYFEEGDPGEWPRSMSAMVNWIASQMGVSIDSRTVVKPYSMDLLTGKTVRELLEYIGAACGGNWTLTSNNELLLVPAFSSMPEETHYLVNEDGDAITLGGVRILV